MMARMDELQCGPAVVTLIPVKSCKLIALYYCVIVNLIKKSLNHIDIRKLFYLKLKILLVYQTIKQPVKTLINKQHLADKNNKYTCA